MIRPLSAQFSSQLFSLRPSVFIHINSSKQRPGISFPSSSVEYVSFHIEAKADESRGYEIHRTSTFPFQYCGGGTGLSWVFSSEIPALVRYVGWGTQPLFGWSTDQQFNLDYYLRPKCLLSTATSSSCPQYRKINRFMLDQST